MIRRWGLVLLLLLGIAWAGHGFVLRQVANFLDVSDPQFPTDYVVSLPGDQNTRTFAAVVILKEGLAEKIAILKNPTDSEIREGLKLPVHEVTQRICNARGIANERMIFLEGESTTTFTDLLLIGKIFETQPDATITLVTSRYHTRRARWAARHTLGDRAEQIFMVGAQSDAYYWDHWWTSGQGLEWIVAEYLKLGYYQIKYASSVERILAVATMCAIAIVGIVWMKKRRRSAKDRAADIADSNSIP